MPLLLAIVLLLVLPTAQAGAPSAHNSEQQSRSDASPNDGKPAKSPCRNPDASGKYHIGCGVIPPVIIHQVEPKYPEDFRGKKLSTAGVVITLTVDAQGNPIDVRLKNSKVDSADKASRMAQQLLEDNMLEAVRHYKFKPATFEGKPVPVDLNLEINIDPF